MALFTSLSNHAKTNIRNRKWTCQQHEMLTFLNDPLSVNVCNDPTLGIRTMSHRNCILSSDIICFVLLHYVVHGVSFILTYVCLVTGWQHMSSTIVLHLCWIGALSQFFTRCVPSVFFRFHVSLPGVPGASNSSVPGRFLQIACLVNLDNYFLSLCPV